jgi:hypothetical protein
MHIERNKREGAEKPNASSRKPAPRPSFSRKGKRHSLRKRESKQKKHIERNKRERERAEKPNAFGLNSEREGQASKQVSKQVSK